MLRRRDLAADPLAQFLAWLDAAKEAGVVAHDAMTLATATADGEPSARMVLLKGASERGLAFYTGYESRKGRELAVNPRAALVFYWSPLGRQVRVEGTVERLPAAESDEYFASRPLGSRISAAVSRQSEVVADRAQLEAAAAALADETVPRPEEWGGFVLLPERWEF